jgi:hypothetical protein
MTGRPLVAGTKRKYVPVSPRSAPMGGPFRSTPGGFPVPSIAVPSAGAAARVE